MVAFSVNDDVAGRIPVKVSVPSRSIVKERAKKSRGETTTVVLSTEMRRKLIEIKSKCSIREVKSSLPWGLYRGYTGGFLVQ
jgi:hypothetical protein